MPLTCNAYFLKPKVRLEGEHKIYSRDAAEGRKMHTYFCPTCGSTVGWTLDLRPNQFGVAVTTAISRPQSSQSGRRRCALRRCRQRTFCISRAVCEFAAVSKRTGKRYWVEAKMRGVKGLLGKTEKDGGSDDDPLSRLIFHLNQAFKKPAQDDRLIFVDINGEPGEIKEGARAPEWVDRVTKRLEQYEKKEVPEGETAYVFVTNMPFHRSLNKSPLIVGVSFGVGVSDFNRPGNYRLSEAYRLKQKHIDAHDIVEALTKYPQMPSTFDGSLPSEALHGEQNRVLIGETYHFAGIGGEDGMIAKVTRASVNEAEKAVYVGTDNGSILSYPMSDKALADYKANPDSYFGLVLTVATKPLTNIYDLFEWLMKTHQHLERDALLQRLAQVPGIESMTDDELRAIFCEGMAGAFQKSFDRRAPIPSFKRRPDPCCRRFPVRAEIAVSTERHCEA